MELGSRCSAPGGQHIALPRRAHGLRVEWIHFARRALRLATGPRLVLSVAAHLRILAASRTAAVLSRSRAHFTKLQHGVRSRPLWQGRCCGRRKGRQCGRGQQGRGGGHRRLWSQAGRRRSPGGGRRRLRSQSLCARLRRGRGRVRGGTCEDGHANGLPEQARYEVRGLSTLALSNRADIYPERRRVVLRVREVVATLGLVRILVHRGHEVRKV
mmetsp:Transcript_124378/g.265037  ORF Transcript_124378/g.265037 Transcript_124378/m.265037 type:complete len:214 (-) Transcript_124378:457-1098(-)